MYDLHLSPEQIEFRDTVREFVEDEVKPVTLKADRLDLGNRTLPVEVLRKASQLGLRTGMLPEDWGGVGADALTACIVTEELAVGDADVAAVLAETSSLALRLFGTMTASQRERFVQTFVDDDDYHLALACREPGDDSALGINYHRPAPRMRLATTAIRTDDHWIVNGAKDAVANAPIAKLIAVEAQTDKGPALFLIPRETPGLTITEQPEPRWYHGSCGQLSLNNVRVPANSLLGVSAAADAGRAIPLAQALNLGIGRAATEAAFQYAQLRVQGGRPIVEHQAIGTKLAECALRLDVVRNAIWRAAWAADHPDAFADRSLPDLPLTTMAKVFTAESIYRVTKDAAECFGAMGVMCDMPLQKYIHDAMICLHAGDGNSDDKLRIAEALIGYRRGPSMLAAE
jgi:alkylation response protein AidB-like acyl-CoA dehydrogenase